MSLEGIDKEKVLAELEEVFSRLFKNLEFLESKENADGSITVKMKGGPKEGEWEHTILNLGEIEPPKEIDPKEWRDVCKIVFT